MSTWKSNCTTTTRRRRGTVKVRWPAGGTHTTYKYLDEVEIKGEVTLEINLAALMQLMGDRALNAKSGRSSCMNGLVKAKAGGRRERLVKTVEVDHGSAVEIISSSDD